MCRSRSPPLVTPVELVAWDANVIVYAELESVSPPSIEQDRWKQSDMMDTMEVESYSTPVAELVEHHHDVFGRDSHYRVTTT